MGLGHYTLISKKWIGIILCDSNFIWLKEGQSQKYSIANLLKIGMKLRIHIINVIIRLNQFNNSKISGH